MIDAYPYVFPITTLLVSIISHYFLTSIEQFLRIQQCLHV